MKKVFSVLILSGLLIAFFLPQAVSATPPDQYKPVETCKVYESARKIQGICPGSGDAKIEEYPMCCLISSVYRVTDWVFFFLMALVVIMVLMGAFSLLTAGGAAEKITTGRNYILWAAVGFLVALLAKSVPAIARMVAGF